MPRFAILTHDHPFCHWDFLLETGANCRTWRLLAEPQTDSPIAAEHLPDHRLKYLDYEGPVGGDRGTVFRWDAGEYVHKAESSTRLEIELFGARIHGCCTIRKVEITGETTVVFGATY